MADINIDAVIVSPVRRTLQTCSIIFEGHRSNPQVFVEPYFRTILEGTNDIGSKVEESMQLFPSFNFDKVKDREAWYIQTLYPEDRTSILSKL
jgi:broad specificity phosphatase PhoE